MVDIEDLGKIKENEWFNAHEKELIRQAKARKEAEARAALQAEAEQLRRLHWMKCPKCGHDMNEIEHEGIKIDECTSCQGIFLDSGELAELLLKSQEAHKSFFRKLTETVFPNN